MGVQRRHNVDLVRHAYVLPGRQGSGIGASLLKHLCRQQTRPILIGTWLAADWAIRFYERHGFSRVSAVDAAQLLRTYWTIPARQTDESVVLSSPALAQPRVAELIGEARAAMPQATPFGIRLKHEL
jgi:N-acetylglutamate synthase-like GNAT family acetyltransferase